MQADKLHSFSEYLLDLYGDMEIELIARVADKFKLSTLPPPTGVQAWYFDMLKELGAFRTQNARIVARYSKKTTKEIQRMLEKAGYAVAEVDETVYRRAFKQGALLTAPGAVQASTRVSQIIRLAYKNAQRQANLVNTTCLESANKAVMDIINRAYLETSTGVKTLQQSTRDAVQKLAKNGIDALHYKRKDGRIITYHTDTAVRRMLITTTNQMAGNIQIERAKEWGCNLMEVSSHAAARPTHAEWQGGIYSIEGATDEYPNLYDVTGYGDVTGLMGANCSHEMFPFIEGVSRQKHEPTESMQKNEQQYEAQQKLRGMERRMRELRRREAAAKAQGDNETLVKTQAKIKEHSKKINQFTDEQGITRRRDRETVA